MADDIDPIDGHVFRSPKEQASYLRFIKEEGAPLLAAYRSIECADVRAAISNLVRVAALDAAKKL